MRAPVTAPLAPALLAAALALPLPARAQPALEEVGSWLTGCATDRMTDRTECRMLHRQPVEPAAAGQAALTLEVMERNGTLVPVVTARDLTLEGAGRGLLALTGTAQLRFPPNRLFEMPCALEGRSVVCAPRPEEAARAATELGAADRALVRMSGLLPGDQMRAEPVELRLARTGEALSRLRGHLPQGVATPPPAPGFDLRDLLDRLMRFFRE